MKRLLCLAICLLALCGCGTAAASEQASSEQSVSEQVVAVQPSGASEQESPEQESPEQDSPVREIAEGLTPADHTDVTFGDELAVRVEYDAYPTRTEAIGIILENQWEIFLNYDQMTELEIWLDGAGYGMTLDREYTLTEDCPVCLYALGDTEFGVVFRLTSGAYETRVFDAALETFTGVFPNNGDSS